MDLGFHFVQMLFWVSLSTWFGGLLFVAAASRVVFQTVRESDPLLPTVLSVNLNGQHGTLMAGSIMSNLLSMVRIVGLYCSGGLLISIGVQWVILDPRNNWLLHTVRSAMFVASVIVLLYEWRFIAPKVSRYRDDYLDHADDPEVANPAKERFDHYAREGITLLMIQVALLLGIIFFSASLTPPPTLMTR